MSNLIFNLRIYKYHFQITKRLRMSISYNGSYDFHKDPFIRLFK